MPGVVKIRASFRPESGESAGKAASNWRPTISFGAVLVSRMVPTSLDGDTFLLSGKLELNR